MRIAVILLSILALGGCTALAVGGGAGGYQVGDDKRPTSVIASDSAITSKIKGNYVADPIVNVFNISVRTYEGRVTLSGIVGSVIARDQAMDLAKAVPGVRTVTNQIIVEE